MARNQRKRPRRRETAQGEMTARELAAKAGVTLRTLRYYVAERILPPPEFRGVATRYSREHLVALAAIRALQQQTSMPLPVIRQYLKTVAPEEITRLAGTFLPALAPLAPPTTPAVVAPPTEAPVESPKETAQLDTWQRLAVLPGLEVHVHSAVSAELKALARELSERMRAGIAQSDRAAD
jgi:DNA-binding transcriptional MerR regulator